VFTVFDWGESGADCRSCASLKSIHSHASKCGVTHVNAELASTALHLRWTTSRQHVGGVAPAGTELAAVGTKVVEDGQKKEVALTKLRCTTLALPVPEREVDQGVVLRRVREDRRRRDGSCAGERCVRARRAGARAGAAANRGEWARSEPSRIEFDVHEPSFDRSVRGSAQPRIMSE
jgi:hypothetical protein